MYMYMYIYGHTMYLQAYNAVPLQEGICIGWCFYLWPAMDVHICALSVAVVTAVAYNSVWTPQLSVP